MNPISGVLARQLGSRRMNRRTLVMGWGDSGSVIGCIPVYVKYARMKAAKADHGNRAANL